MSPIARAAIIACHRATFLLRVQRHYLRAIRSLGKVKGTEVFNRSIAPQLDISLGQMNQNIIEQLGGLTDLEYEVLREPIQIVVE